MVVGFKKRRCGAGLGLENLGHHVPVYSPCRERKGQKRWQWGPVLVPVPKDCVLVCGGALLCQICCFCLKIKCDKIMQDLLAVLL